MDCDAFRKTYRSCVEAYGYRECRLDLDELFVCLHKYEKNRI
jgi:hypothetical protein